MLNDKWEAQTPSFDPPTKEQIENLREQAKWDARIKRILTKLIKAAEEKHEIV